MPYDIKRDGRFVVLVNSKTGKVKSHHANVHKARAAVAHIAENEGRKFSALVKPSGRKKYGRGKH